ncbi:hypothetical protein GF369_02740 [Candidatus Peregrinibacteria bacterium]|nr:hypothetical protein [Candidatus Peregrinibacteria bacterium]
MKKSYNDREVDKKKLDKSKKYLWRYIQKKKKLGGYAKEKKEKKAFFATLFAPKKIAWASVIAVLTIIAVVVGPNLQNLLRGGIGTVPNIAYASFEMTPSNQDSTGIDSDTTFTLTSTEDVDAAVIEANLETTPETDINVSKTAEGEYRIEAAQSLNANTIYTFSIVSNNEDGPEEFSWAYQVKDDFKINGTLPGDKTSGVPVTSGIEIHFSHEQFNLEETKNYVHISPETEGAFEKHQKTLVYVPREALKLGTIYTVTVEKGLPLIGSEKTLQEGKTFQFETAPEQTSFTKFHFNNNAYEVGTDQPVALKGYLRNFTGNLENEPVTAPTTVYAFANQKDYLSIVNNKNDLPTWARAARSNYKVDTSTLTKTADIEGQIGKVNWQSYLYLPDINLQEGYYLVEVTMNGHITQTFLQVTDLSAYISVTKTDSIVWVNDVQTGKPVPDATVKIIETGETTTTDSRGIAQFTLTPEEWGYYNVAIASPEEKTLVTELSVISAEANGDDYWSLINTDRPVYLPDDTIRFWGFLKPRTSMARPLENLTLKITGGWEGTTIDTVDFEMDSDTTFSGSYELKDMPAGFYYLSLYDGDTYVMQEYIQIQTYKKPTYDINVKADKNAYYAGETIYYDISSEFFDGTPMPHLELIYKDTNSVEPHTKKTIKTDEKGKASIEQTAKITSSCDSSSSYCYDVQSNYLTLRPVMGEDSDIFGEESVRVFRSHLDLDVKTDEEDNKAMLDISAHWIDLDKLNNETNTSYNDYLGDAAQDRTIKGTIIEKYWEKIEIGQHYDFIEKQTVKEYRYEVRSNPYGEFTVGTDAKGNAQYDFDMQPDKYYEIRLEAPDNDGNKAHYTAYVYNPTTPRSEYYRVDITNSKQDGRNRFSINDTVEAALTNGDSPVADLKGGRVLFLQYNNGLLDYSIKNDPYYSFIFGSEHVPGVTINGIWFDGDTYKIGWGDYAWLDTTHKELEVRINTDKDSYEPGEKVTLSLEVSDKNDKPVQAEVNLNLVDEAYYKAVYDNIIDPLSDIYSSSGDGVLSTYGSHQNPEVKTSEGMGGCFTKGTKILMANGTYKTIEHIRKGDMILTKRAPFSNKLVAAKVTNTVEHTVNGYMVVNDTLEVTGEHVLLINGKWDTASTIKVGDRLLGKDNEEIPVTSVRTVTEQTNVYNFEVEKYHTYIANDIYVHNDKGGDGVRNDFEDTATFQSVTTNSNGKARLEFQVPDNVTTWRVMATAIDTENLQVGLGVDAVQVTLPLFGDFIMNKEYSIKDTPKIGIRAFGESLSDGDAVAFGLTAESLGIEDTRDIEGKAYQANYQPLPELIKGTHTIQLDVEANGKKDALSEDILVRGSRLNKSIVDIIPKFTNEDDIPLPDEGYAQVYLMDGGVSSYYGALMHLYYSHGERLEKHLGEKAAIELLDEYFDQDFAPHYNTDFEEYQQNDGGLAILPYADSDLTVSALTVAFDNNPERYNERLLKKYFENYYTSTDSNLSEITASLLGLASLNEPVLTSLNAIQNEEKLSTVDMFYIGLAFEQLGSKEDAKKMYNRAISEMDETSVQENALATVLAASLQYKDDAATYWNEVRFYTSKDDLLNLYLIGYVKEGLAYASDKKVSFTVHVGNMDEDKTLEQCEVYSALAHSTKGIRINNIEGDLAAVVHYKQAVQPKQFKRDDRVRISRTYEVVGEPEKTYYEVDDIVKITLKFSVNETMPDKAYHIVDIVPSGLQILGNPGSLALRARNPYKIYNQEAHFSYFPGQYSTPVRTYYAKVIHPGTFYADPAKIEVFENPEIANISGAKTIEIQ